MMTDRETCLQLALIHSKAFSLFQRAELFRHFGSLGKMLEVPESDLKNAGFSESQRQFIENLRNHPDEMKSLAERQNRDGVGRLSAVDSRYPQRLLEIPDHPWILFYKGDASLVSRGPLLAVVGSRRMTDYGRRVVEKLIPPLVNAGVVIVSGMAMGVDAWAEEVALDCGGKVVAVQAQGVDRGYPRSQDNLYRRVANAGLVVSEFHEEPEYVGREMFPRRNRIISGLSDGVLVVEAAEKSGSLVTAYLGLEQNRQIYAVPGDIDREFSRGCLKLIRQGAKAVVEAGDILEDLVGDTKQSVRKIGFVQPQNEPVFDNDLEKNIHGICRAQPATLDEIMESVEAEASQVASTLVAMELSGKLKSLSGGRYSILN